MWKILMYYNYWLGVAPLSEEISFNQEDSM